jgi:hypothetical protein
MMSITTTEIDIDRPARALAVLRWSDYVMVVGCGLGVLGMLPDLVLAIANGQWIAALLETAIVATFSFAAYTGWRHVGVIDPRVWYAYLWIFPLLTAVTGVLAVATAIAGWSQGWAFFDDPQPFATLLGVSQFGVVAIPGFVCVMLLRRMRVGPTNARLDDLLTGLTGRGGVSSLGLTHLPRLGMTRGLAYAVGGVVILLCVAFVPLPLKGLLSDPKVGQLLGLLGCFLIVRARRHFQVSGDALLAVDKRPPILFLRSFADDERQQYGNSQRALLDFSLETRLANHFHRFGPFIAVGSPKESVPLPGAARVVLRDDEWQSRVLGWMKESHIIIMYCGTTEWVTWELRKVVESGRSTSLILMVPETHKWRSSRRNNDIARRVDQVRGVFDKTPWNEALMEFKDFARLRAMLFRADGSMVMVTSRSRSRDAYHLSALVAHHQLLGPLSAPQGVVARADARWLRRATVGFGATAIAAAVGLGAANALRSSHSTRLTFKGGELHYKTPITHAQASGVGEYLAQHLSSENRRMVVQLDHDRDQYRLHFIVNPARGDDFLGTVRLGIVGPEISRDVLGGKAVEVLLSDNHLRPIKVVPASATLMFGKAELYYTAPVTADEASKVGQLLLDTGFFRDDREATAFFGWEDGTYHLRFVVDSPSRMADRETLDDLSKLGSGIAVLALDGQPLVVHLSDETLRTWHRIHVESQPGEGRR